MTPEFIRDLLTAALMTADEPLNLERLKQLFEPESCPDKAFLQRVLDELCSRYADAPVVLVRTGDAYRFQSHTRFKPWLGRLAGGVPAKPSRAFMETLAIIAYRQPITRAEIEEIRGVVVSPAILKTLYGHGWIRVLGHRETPGHPELLGTTPAFLAHFGLEGLQQLPPLDDLKDLDQIAATLA